jgi:tricorn protease
MKPLLCLAIVLFLFTTIYGQNDPLWLRYPAISPDGQTLLFEYKGDIWSVPTAGGTAVPLTLSESYEFAPVWSHDGKSIGFASDRYGNIDVFIMPAGGGDAKRLTYHSTREVPISFTADDKAVLFAAQRQDLATNVQFPTPGMAELYSVPVNGGRVSQILTSPALDATVSSTGDKILSRLQGVRERLAKTPHLVRHSRRLGVRRPVEKIHSADELQRRGPQSGLRL